MKRCFKCRKIKSLDAFYAHKEMADGLLGKCKSCTKKDVRTRVNSPAGNAKVKEYDKTRNKKKERRVKMYEYLKKHRSKYPLKASSRRKFEKAVFQKKIKRGECVVCKEPNAQGHHPNYREPLKVVWLCRVHHLKTHGGVWGKKRNLI